MLALFIALSCAVCLVLWAEFGSKTRKTISKGQEPASVVPFEELRAVARKTLARRGVTPATPPASAPALPAEDLPRITGFRPGDVIELSIEGPLPRPGEMRIEQVGRDTRVLIAGLPPLIFERTRARSLRYGTIRFCAAA